MKNTHSISITNNLLKTTLESLIKHNNKNAIVELLANMLTTSPNGIDYFIRFSLGEPYPNLPEINTSGLVAINDLVWASDDREILRNSVFNKNDCIEVVVLELNGLHEYSPLKISFPFVENDETSIRTANISLDRFIVDDFGLFNEDLAI